MITTAIYELHVLRLLSKLKSGTVSFFIIDDGYSFYVLVVSITCMFVHCNLLCV